MSTTPQAIYGIIGNPVEHSLSPLMHNAAFEALEVDAVYKRFPLQADELPLFFEDLKEANNPIFGLNVTVPYKEAVLPYMDRLDPLAQRIQAVNTIVIDHERTFVGYNTDGPGFMCHLAELGVETKGKRVAIMGAGGTAKAIISVLCLLKDRPDSIRLYNRTTERAEAMMQDLAQRFDTSVVEVVNSVDDLNIELSDMLINTTSVGLNDNSSLIDESLLHSNLLVYDVIYKTGGTALLNLAKSVGASTADGIGMLFYQGILAFQHWAGQELSPELKQIMRDSLEEGRGV